MLRELDCMMALIQTDYYSPLNSAQVLELIERCGMLPPSTPAKNIHPTDHRWGGGCSMRCNCDDCNPNFPMNVWEKE